MAEKPTSPEIPKTLEHVREEREYGVELSEKLAQYLRLPVSGEALYDSLQEIFSGGSSLENIQGSENKKKSTIDKSIAELRIMSERTTAWSLLLKKYENDPTLDIADYDSVLKGLNMSLLDVIMGTLKFGAQKEDALQKIKTLQLYHLPKTAALWSSILIETTQEFGEDALGRENINKYLYGGTIAGIYKTALDPLRTDARIRRSRIEFSSDLRKAQEIINQAQPAMDRELAKKGLTDAARKKLYGRAVVFLSEDPIGRKMASMVSQTAESAVGKSAGSIISGMREGFVSPLCAAMFACSIDGAPDKEKAIIQYFTFLFAGQLAQEGAKPLGSWLVKFLEKMSPKGDTQLAKIGKWLMSDVPKTKLAIVAASVAVVCSVFGIKSVAEKINGIAEWLDQKTPHGKWREAAGNAFQIVGTIAAWELVLGWELTKELSGMNGVNPFKDQLDYLREHPGKNGVEAWNRRVSEIQNGGVIDKTLGLQNGPVQKSIIELQKIQSPESWAEQNIVPFQLQLGELDIIESSLFPLLRSLTLTPSSAEKLLGDSEKLRYREYALSENDVWNTRDHLVEDESNILTVGITKFNRLAGLNDKAIIWLEDMKGGRENRIDGFFENLDSLIEQEKNKCRILVSPAQGYMNGGYSPPQYRDDVEALKKIEPWIASVKEAKKQWVTMRALSLEVAKKVTVARSLGAYNQSQWSASFLDQGSLAFHGYMDQIARDTKMREITTPTNASQSANVIDAAGSGVRMYGDDMMDGEWRRKRDEEYKKWVEKNGFGIDDRHIHADRVKQLIQAAYKEGIAQEYIQDALRPISDIARNQVEGNYITPDLIRELELKLANHLLDKAFRESVKVGVIPENIGQVSYSCSGYDLIRIFTVNGDQITAEDRIKTTSYRAVFDGVPSQVLTSERTLQKRTENLGKFKKRFETIRSLKIGIEDAKRKEQEELLQLSQEAEKTRILLRKEQEKHKGDSVQNFIEFYQKSPDGSYGKWDTISDKHPLVLAFRDYRGGYSARIEQKEGWGWSVPTMSDQVKVAIYWEPGKTKEFSIASLSDLNNPTLDEGTKKVLREVLTSGRLVRPFESLISLTSGSDYHEKVTRKNREGKKFYDLEFKESYIKNLREKLLPYFEKAPDKKAFLGKLLDALLKQPGISGDTFDTIVRETLQ